MATIEGLTEILETLTKIENVEKLESAVGEACALIEKEAKKKAPKQTGDLRRSIESDVENKGTAIEGKVFTTLEYAPYVEYGTGLFAEKGGRKDVPWNYRDEKGNWHSTSGQHPHPYMRPALNENREKALKLIEKGLKLEK